MAATSNEALLREIISGHAALAEKVDGLRGRVDAVQKDAREARDAALEMAATSRAQDVSAQLVRLQAAIETSDRDRRSDLVNAVSKLTSETRTSHAEHELRIIALERMRQRMAGATGLLGWIGRNAPWLAAAIIAVATVVERLFHHP